MLPLPTVARPGPPYPAGVTDAGPPHPLTNPVSAAQRHAALLTLEGRNRACRACDLRPGCTQVVVAEGRADAPLLIVGEGPGGQEDLTGRPFVGRGGQLLDQILHVAGIDRADAYITNIVKCRPPGNRDPHPPETQTCTAHWLEPQLTLLRPRVILAVGHTATSYLLGTRARITDLRGQWFPYRHADGQGGTYEAPLMPLLHPAYLLRHDTRAPGGPKSLTWRDIREAAAVLRGDHQPAAFGTLAPADMQGQPGLF